MLFHIGQIYGLVRQPFVTDWRRENAIGKIDRAKAGQQGFIALKSAN
jgi:hypothetical protein